MSKEARIAIAIVWTVCAILCVLLLANVDKRSFATTEPIRSTYTSPSGRSHYTSSSSSYSGEGYVSTSGKGDLEITNACSTGDAYRADAKRPNGYYRNLAVWGTLRNNGSEDIVGLTVRVTAEPYVFGKTFYMDKLIVAGFGARVNFTKDLGVFYGEDPIGSASVSIVSYKLKSGKVVK